jgi:NADH:ubiquinone oxidoreductase subunit B-like Fe-S oxidoreductase
MNVFSSASQAMLTCYFIQLDSGVPPTNEEIDDVIDELVDKINHQKNLKALEKRKKILKNTNAEQNLDDETEAIVELQS